MTDDTATPGDSGDGGKLNRLTNHAGRIATATVLSTLTLSTTVAAQAGGGGGGGGNPITNFLDAFGDWVLPAILMLLFFGAVVTFGLSRGPFGPETKNRMLNSAKGCLLGLFGVILLVLSIPEIFGLMDYDVGNINPFVIVGYGVI